MTTTFILGFSSVQFLRMTMTFRDGGAGFISQSMNRNSDFDNTSVRIWMNSIEETLVSLRKWELIRMKTKKMTCNLCLWLEVTCFGRLVGSWFHLNN